MAPPIRTRPSFPLSQSLPLKGCCSTTKDPVFLASRGEEFNPGPEMRLDRSEFLYNRVFLKCSFSCVVDGGERLLLTHKKTPGFLASGGEEFNPGPDTRLDLSELLCNKVLLKYKEIVKASDIDIRRGQKEYPLTSVSNGVIYLLISYYNESKECLEVVKTLLDPLP